jgi:hypothetical protein
LIDKAALSNLLCLCTTAKFFALVHAGTPVEIAQSQPEDQTIGRSVIRPADYKYPDPPGSYMVSSAVFTQP